MVVVAPRTQQTGTGESAADSLTPSDERPLAGSAAASHYLYLVIISAYFPAEDAGPPGSRPWVGLQDGRR